MKFDKLRNDNSAVSPVIGVILMVAITVILAAVIASFVLGLGPDTATTPTATFSTEYSDDTAAGAGGTLTITMESGETLDPSNIYIRGDEVDNGDWNYHGTDVDEITAGSSREVDISSDDYTVRLIYEEGDTSSTIQTFEA